MLEENELQPTTQQRDPFDASSRQMSSPADISTCFSILSAYYQSRWTIPYHPTWPTSYPVLRLEFSTAALIKYQSRVPRRLTTIHIPYTPELHVSQGWIAHLGRKYETGLKLNPNTGNPPWQLTSFEHTVCVAGLRSILRPSSNNAIQLSAAKG
jgi:hypothetical protein